MEETDRTKFLVLDALAKVRGGLAMLTLEEQISYIFFGINEGLLPLQKAYDIACTLKLEENYLFKEFFSELGKTE